MAEPNFEMPAQMREFIEKSVDQARSAYESFAGAAEKVVSSVEAVLPSGAKEVSDKVFAHSQANIEATFDFAKKLAHVKDAQEFMQVHSDFAKAQMETIQKQTSELGAAIQKAVTGTTGKSSGFS